MFKTKIFKMANWAQGATGNSDPHRCALDSNNDFLFPNDHWSQKCQSFPWGWEMLEKFDNFDNSTSMKVKVFQ